MSTTEKVAKMKSDTKPNHETEFSEQISRHKEFQRKMLAAGVKPKKQEFSISLMERIRTKAFSK